MFNFCPRSENEYDAAYFNNQVSRFPFPDHHPPPLSMIPLVTRTMHDWLNQNDKNVVVIHCKAGKGRSGTMCCCYLLSLPTLPRPPQLPQNYSRDQPMLSKQDQFDEHRQSIATSNHDESSTSVDSDSDDDLQQPSRPQSGGAASVFIPSIHKDLR